MLRPYKGLTTLLVTLGLGACGGGGGSTPSPSPPAATNLSMSITKTAAHLGDTTVTMTWSSTNATSCTASGSWSGTQNTSGTVTLPTTATGTNTYQITCNGTGPSAQDSVTLNVVPPPVLVTLPGLPAPVPISPGPCVAGSDANFQYICVSSESAVAATFDTASSALSNQAMLTAGASTPAVQAGGSCSAGFSAMNVAFTTTTPFGNDTISFTGAEITEVTYSAAYLASIGAQNLTNLVALVIGDSSNAAHFEVLFYSQTASSSLNYAAGGAITLSNDALAAFNVVECLGVPAAPPPPPPPPPGSLTCSGHSGSGTNGISFPSAQQMPRETWLVSTTTASQTNTTNILWGASYADPAQTNAATTGSLRVSLWEMVNDYSGGSYSGYGVATAYPNFIVGAYPDSPSTSQLYNNTFATNINSSVSGANPPAGSYCSVLLLEEYITNPQTCTSADHYCIVDYREASSPTTFH
jgi:hypothetical protein